jgi:anti-sigma B factor antagonist
MDDMAGPLVIDERRVDGVVIVSVSKGLKGPGEEALKQRLDTLVGQGFLRILVDLGEVPYLDSTDLGRLMRCHIAVRRAGGRVRLFNASDKIRTLMKMTRLDTVMELYETEADALATLSQSQSVAGSLS